MPMQLYIVRHGQAVESEAWTGAERDRPLTAEGRDEMRAAARGLRRLGVDVDAVYTSPLGRARATADFMAAALDVSLHELDQLAPGASLDALAHVLSSHPHASALLVVGHEPDLSTMIGQLIGPHGPAHVEMKKGACCRVNVPDTSASSSAALQGRGTLAWLLTAKQLARLGA
jgi:phosphohistidine phosphatase